MMAMNAKEIAAIDRNHFRSSMDSLRGTAFEHHFGTVRNDLEAEREEAKKRGDKVGIATAELLLAHNTANSLDKAIELEKNPDKRAELEAKSRDQQKLLEVQQQKLREALEEEAKKKGLSGADAQAHVDTGMKHAQDRANKLKSDTQSLSADIQDKAVLTQATGRAEEERNRGKLTVENDKKTTFSVKIARNEAVLVKDQEAGEIAKSIDPFADVNTITIAQADVKPDNIMLAQAQAKAINAKQTGAKPEGDSDKNDNVQQPAVPNKVAAAKGNAPAPLG